jgi:FkbM family methyltransferase
MRSFTEMVKAPIRSTLQLLGLYGYAQNVKRFITTIPYRNIDIFSATLNGVTVRFCTEDEYSKSWFFPRYAGGGIHEKVVTGMLVGELQSARCFADIGAHLGWFTCVAAKHMPLGNVFGFEMDNLSFSLLEQNVATNDCANVEVYNVAVSDVSGIASYKRYSMHPNAALRLQANTKDEQSGSVSVDSVALDEFFESKGVAPDVVKIDVEGAEMNVLMGMRQTLRNCRPVLFLEIHPPNLRYFNTSTSAIFSLLIEHHYSVFEVESMRSHESKKRLRLLRQDSILEDNTMLYATAEGETDPNVA